MPAKEQTDRRVLVANRKARHDYEILETIEAGMSLLGSEVKSIRAGRANMGDSYAAIEGDQAWLISLHVSPYTQANLFNHEPLRKRRLLLHKAQIRRLSQKTLEKGLTLIPLALVLVRSHIKIELALARGKRLYDKREAKARQDADREIQRARRERDV
jgi:SsrA-binding protein